MHYCEKVYISKLLRRLKLYNWKKYVFIKLDTLNAKSILFYFLFTPHNIIQATGDTRRDSRAYIYILHLLFLIP